MQRMNSDHPGESFQDNYEALRKERLAEIEKRAGPEPPRFQRKWVRYTILEGTFQS